jgi:hypothetical protein
VKRSPTSFQACFAFSGEFPGTFSGIAHTSVG